MLSWFVNHGYLTNTAGHLNSMYGYGPAGVDVAVDDATGDVYVTLIQAPPATFSETPAKHSATSVSASPGYRSEVWPPVASQAAPAASSQAPLGSPTSGLASG